MKNKLRHLDLCAGIAGFSLAVKWAGGKTVAIAEVDHYACKTVRKNFGRIPNLGNIKNIMRRAGDCEQEDEEGEVFCPRCSDYFSECSCVGSDAFFDEYGFPNFVSIGFPCQEVTTAYNAHRKKNQKIKIGIKGKRSSLWEEGERIVGEISPPFLILENSPALRVRGADRILTSLERQGYACWPFVVGAWAAGGQIKRDRTWIVGIQESYCERLERDVVSVMENAKNWRSDTYAPRSDWGHATSRICSASDGIPNRVGQIKCYGNSVVPQVAYPFLSLFNNLLEIAG